MVARVTRKPQAFPFAHERYQFYLQLEVHFKKKHGVTHVLHVPHIPHCCQNCAATVSGRKKTLPSCRLDFILTRRSLILEICSPSVPGHCSDFLKMQLGARSSTSLKIQREFNLLCATSKRCHSLSTMHPPASHRHSILLALPSLRPPSASASHVFRGQRRRLA